MRDKYNLNTLPAGLAGLDEIDLGEIKDIFFTKFRFYDEVVALVSLI